MYLLFQMENAIRRIEVAFYFPFDLMQQEKWHYEEEVDDLDDILYHMLQIRAYVSCYLVFGQVNLVLPELMSDSSLRISMGTFQKNGWEIDVTNCKSIDPLVRVIPIKNFSSWCDYSEDEKVDCWSTQIQEHIYFAQQSPKTELPMEELFQKLMPYAC